MNSSLLNILAAGALLAAAPTLTTPVGPAPNPPVPTAPESVEVRYARAQLQLAEANLEKVQRMNQRVTGAVPAEIAAEYQQDVSVAKTRLDDVLGVGGSNPFQVWLRRAETAAQSAERQWKNALATNRRAAGTVDPLDVERLRLRYEVARLDFERGQALADAPAESQLKWQVSLLENQIQRLNEEVLRQPPPSRYYPLWWY